MWLSFSCILEFPLFPPYLHNACSCYYLHSQIDADKDSVFWLVNLHPSSIQVERKIGCISIPSNTIQVFGFKFLVWYTRSKNLNGDLDAKLVSCIPGLREYTPTANWVLPQNRVCHRCNTGEIDDEIDYLFKCVKYTQERAELNDQITLICQNINNLDNNRLLWILNNENYIIL